LTESFIGLIVARRNMQRCIWGCYFCLDDVHFEERYEHLLNECEEIPQDVKDKLATVPLESRQMFITSLEISMMHPNWP
jgi:hypothetical protein